MNQQKVRKVKVYMKKEYNLFLDNNIFFLAGSVNYDNVKIILSEGIKLLNNLNEVTVDLSKLENCDSSALALLLAWKREFMKKNIEIKYINSPNFLISLCRVSNLEEILLV